MTPSDIEIRGAREHNLRDVDVTLPRNRLICLTGVSGSGKSSLAFDTLYAEGQRRYVESLSSFARQYLGQMQKPDVDSISGLSPSISISQKTSGQNPRSTVGTITEIYDFLRVLYARIGKGHCPQCGAALSGQSREQLIERALAFPQGTRLTILAPLIRGQKGEYRDLFADLLKQGFLRARADGRIVELTDNPQLDRQMRHNIEVVVDRLVIGPEARPRVAEAVEAAVRLGQGDLMLWVDDGASEGKAAARSARAAAAEEGGGGGLAASSGSEPIYMSSRYACVPCGLAFEPPGPQLFSFNSPRGMCPTCQGLGEVYDFETALLVPDPKLSIEDGAVAAIGPWDDLGKYRKHIFQGVAETLERVHKLPAGSILKTPWEKLPEEIRTQWLHGTGDLHVTFSWTIAGRPEKYGGKYAGVIAQLLTTYRESNSKPQREQLEAFMTVQPCRACGGKRLNAQARAVVIRSKHPEFAAAPELALPDLCDLPILSAQRFFSELELTPTEHAIAVEALKEIRGRLGFLLNVGLDYLTLARTAPTLSGGESQRIRLAGQVGCGLVGVTYILDEPSIGLHPRDNDRLLDTLRRLRDQGNTVVVVEHDEDTMLAADRILDFGPGPGVRGGRLVAQGSVREVMESAESLTGQYLAGTKRIEIPVERRPPTDRKLTVFNARHHNLKGIDAQIPLGLLVCVTGVSGSGKSSLVLDIVGEALQRDLNGGDGEPGLHDRITGLEHLDKLIAIDQSPIGRTPRSNPATYIKVFDEIRDLFAQMPESKARGYNVGRFSFNKPGGRCEACEGNGANKLEMDFLADVWVPCPVCNGKRFNRETLQVKFKDKSIADILEMDVPTALELFKDIPPIAHKLKTLHDVGLDYLRLGQASPTLSGGEAQRVKLARELVKRSTGRTMYLLDEPTTGLHFADIHRLIDVLQSFVKAGNTVLVIEHNLDVIKTADWIIEIGPEGGAGGGRITAEGTPEDIIRVPESPTGKFLKKVFERDAAGGRACLPIVEPPPAAPAQGLRSIVVQGASQHNLKHIDAEIPRDKMTVCCGLSGSGKSSLAMDTIYAEGQRRYIESLSAYARQFLGQMQKPKVDHVAGLSPAVAIEQKNLGHTPRSTVGTVTEIYDYLRVFFARLGTPYCPECEIPIGTQTSDQIVDQIMEQPAGTKIHLLAPLTIEAGERYDVLWDELKKQGYLRVRVDGLTTSLEEAPKIDRKRKHAVEVVIDRIVVKAEGRRRIADGVEAALSLGRGVLLASLVEDKIPETDWTTVRFSQHLACRQCGQSFEPLAPHHFSFNSGLGWCTACEGLGTQLGTNPAALLRDPRATLRQGAPAIWPDVTTDIGKAMLEGLSAKTGIPLDVPFEQLTAKQKRSLYYGTGEAWIDVRVPPPPAKSAKAAAKAAEADPATRPLWFRYRFKGLYDAIDEACRISPAFRAKFDELLDTVECTTCGGSRLRLDAGAVRFRGRTLDDVCRMPLGEVAEFFGTLDLDARERKIAGELIREIAARTRFLVDVGLDYITLHRAAPTLSGGETQRIRLASQIGSGLTGVLYVLDEPTIGLHPRDNSRLIRALERLRDLGNTLLLVEHDREVIAGADYLLDFGPQAGSGGGRIVASGTPAEVRTQAGSITGPYLAGTKNLRVPIDRRMAGRLGRAPGAAPAPAAVPAPVAVPAKPVKKSASRKKAAAAETMPSVAATAKKSAAGPLPEEILEKLRGLPEPLPLSPAAAEDRTGRAGSRGNASAEGHRGWLRIVGARHNNLKNIDAAFPLGALTAVTGVSGGGKSSLVEDILYPAISRQLHRTRAIPGAHDSLLGLEQINKVICVDQQPLGNSPTSTPVTYTGVFEQIRELFAQLPDSKIRGYTARRFSFNVSGGRCDACEGSGQKLVEMHFLPDVWVECESCRGQRYNPETLAVRYRGKSINDVLEMSCREALELFANIPAIRRTLQLLCDVGLDYLKLGQSAPTLSGGEAQRVKLAAELARPDTGKTLYLLDEPTTGLHFEDLAKLLDVLDRLVELGNTVVVIEHNLDVLKTADWLIELGPEAGTSGGNLVTCGTPEDLAAYAKAWQESYGNGSTAKPAFPRCHTGEALAPVLASGPYGPRRALPTPPVDAPRPGDLELEEVGAEAKMPWEIDGRKWHLEDRVARDGTAVRWDSRILSEAVDVIEQAGGFAETNWNDRTTVEITGPKKSYGWFFHASTGNAWLVTLKFRVGRNTFKEADLVKSLDLKPLNDLPELPVYGSGPRVKLKTEEKAWQEVQLQVHSFDEIDRPEFYAFLETAIDSFRKLTEERRTNPEDVTPWKVLGEKWHRSTKGFPPGKSAVWPAETLDKVLDLLPAAAPDGTYQWGNQLLVHYVPDGGTGPWATIHTKKAEALELHLSGPKGRFPLGRFHRLAEEAELISDRPDRDVVKLRFVKAEPLNDTRLAEFLHEHLTAWRTTLGSAAAE